MIHSSNSYLTLVEMQENAQYILDSLINQGWTKNSICGMLGNMQSESTINPGIWESLNEGNMSGGFGLVQWTPATKFTDWADQNNYTWSDIDGQLTRILYEVANNLQWQVYTITFAEFTTSTDTPENLASVFIHSYERPLNYDTEQTRREQARHWFDVLTTNEPTKKKKTMPIWMYKFL
jgi:hypothetical protein